MSQYILDLHINKEEWNIFVINHINGNVFQTYEMFQVYEKTKFYQPFFLSVRNYSGELVGILLSNIQKERLYGKLSARSIILGGPLVKDNNLDVLDFILKEFKKRIRGKAIYTQFRNLWHWSDQGEAIFFANGFKNIDHLDILTDLKHTDSVLFTKIHPGRRKNIRRAERVPLIFEQVTDQISIEQCELLIAETYKKLKLPYPDKSFFESANSILGSEGILKIFVAKYLGIIIGCRYELCYKDLVYDWYAGTNERHLDKYPNDFIPWKIMQWGHNNGYTTFDFGGAGKPDVPYGVREHKLKFGGNIVNNGRFEQVHNKLFYLTGSLGVKVFRLLK
jgi:serine/alanine adding enzyme